MIRNEKRAKLTKLQTDRKIRKRNKRAKLNPQDEALKAKRRDTHENIASVPQTVNGKTSLTTNPTKVKEAVATYFKDHLGQRGPEMLPPPEWLQRELSQDRYTGSYTLDKPFTRQELRYTLAHTKNSAAPGKDGIPAAAYKFAVQHAPEGQTSTEDLLLTIAQAIYDAKGLHIITKEIVCKPLYKKAGVKDLTNLRPIALQNALAKIPSKILATRLANDLYRNQAIHSANEGFLKGKNTGSALATILNVWEDAKAHNKPCYCVSYDQAKAYDHLRWFTIKHGMQRLNIPPKFQDYILGKMRGSTIEFKTHYGNTTPFEIKRGTAQGCPLSPLIYIISMDLMHAGLHTNPIREDAQDGYKMKGSTRAIADKCYADDTLIMSNSKDGLVRMNAWVNAFCRYNYISMNQKKTKIFGLDEKRQDIQLSLPVVQHTKDGPITATAHSQSATTHIKHLGLWMNMHLDWTRAISDISSKIGWHRHIIHANALSPEAAIYLINTVLGPKLEYRLRFFVAPDKTLEHWDRDLCNTLNNTYNTRCWTNRQALTTLAKLILPSKVQDLAMITHLQRTVAAPDQSDAGWTTRLRLRSTRYPLEQTDMHVNWNKSARNRASTRHKLELLDTPTPNPPKHWENIRAYPYQAGCIQANIEGQAHTLPTDFYGTWGEAVTPKTVAVYTDGSMKSTSTKTSGAWAAVLHDDSYQKNWTRLHEKEGRKPRLDLIRNLKTPWWGGSLPRPRSSYNTELEAIVRMSMILPSSWNVTIWTDSKSAIDRIESLRASNPIKTMIEPEWELLRLFATIDGLRKQPVTLKHIKSHTKQMEITSIGNAAADLKAEYARLLRNPVPMPEPPPSATADIPSLPDEGENHIPHYNYQRTQSVHQREHEREHQEAMD
jgi:ribonuclease HI